MPLAGSSAEFKVIINNKIYMHMRVWLYVQCACVKKRDCTRQHKSFCLLMFFFWCYYVLLLEHRCWLKWLIPVPRIRRSQRQIFGVCLCDFFYSKWKHRKPECGMLMYVCMYEYVNIYVHMFFFMYACKCVCLAF